MKRNRGGNITRNIKYKRECLEKNILWPDCVYCESSFFYLDAQLDHIEPFSFGGSDELKNVVPVCRDCNQSKASKLLIGWLLEKKISPESVYKRLKALNKSIPKSMLDYLNYES